MIINTVETEKQNFFLNKLLLNDKPLLFVGPTGTGKSAITNAFLLELPKEKYIPNNVNFSAQTSANQTQDIIFSKLDRSVYLTEIFILVGLVISVCGYVQYTK